jgi:hypothetical protein
LYTVEKKTPTPKQLHRNNSHRICLVDETALSSPAQTDQTDWEAESGSLSQTGSGYGSEDTESESRSPPPLKERRKKFNGNFRGGQDRDKNTRYKKDSFVPDKAPKDQLDAAWARVNKAYALVPAKVHHSRKNRATETLYVGNLAFNRTEEDLSEALKHYLGIGIVVENVTIPCVNGKSKYGFIELSWAQATMLDIDDVMIQYSGVLKVNERRIYLRELLDKGNKQ